MIENISKLPTAQIMFLIAIAGMVGGIAIAWLFQILKTKPPFVRACAKILGLGVIYDETNNTYHHLKNTVDACDINTVITQTDPEQPVDTQYQLFHTPQTLTDKHPTAKVCKHCKW